MPQVSVVIPVFNSAALLRAALDSVFAQTFKDFEVIVIDDGSDEQAELAAVVSTYPDVLFVRQTNGGPARARNTGIDRATGEFVAFLDADDEWLPEKLARQVQYFREYPETGLLHTGVVDAPRGGGDYDAPPGAAFCDVFHTRVSISTLTVMIPRRLLLEVGGFDERREIHVEDWDLWLRIAADHPVGYISAPLAYHRRGGLMSRQIDRTYLAQMLVMQKNKALCDRACALRRQEPGRCDRARLHVLHRDWGHERLESGDRRGAREQLRRALTYSPFDPWTLRVYLLTLIRNRWRTALRTVLTGDRNAASQATPPSRDRQPGSMSLVHDTAYRRMRRAAVGMGHTADDAIAKRMHRRKRVLFEAASPMSFTVFRPLYERLKGDPRLDIWFTSYGTVWDTEELFAECGITSNVVRRADAAWLKVDAYVNADFWDMTWLRRRTRRIHLFHGVAGKYNLDAPVELIRAIAGFDCLMFVNADRRKRYIEAGLAPDDPSRAPLVGYPKVDCLVDGSLDTAGIRHELRLDPRVPTVMYAPTWSPYSSLNAMGEEIINRLASAGLQVIVKLHDRSYDRRKRGSGGIDWARRLSRYADHPLVRIVRQPDGSPLMAVADAMVSDHSSIAFEYLLLDRPLVVIDRPDLITHARINPEKVKRLSDAADVADTPDAMISSLGEALRRPNRLSVQRRRVATDLFHAPGTATERALAHLYRLMDIPAPKLSHATVDSPTQLVRVG